MKKIITIIIVILIIVLAILILKTPVKKLIYPINYQEIVQKYSKEYGVDEYLIYATIKAESNFNEKAESKKGAKGLMQLMKSTAEEVARLIGEDVNDENILDSDININLGTKYLSNLMKQYNSIELALAAYNAGSGNVDKWIQNGTLKNDGSNWTNIPYNETKKYVRKILMDYEIYMELYKE